MIKAHLTDILKEIDDIINTTHSPEFLRMFPQGLSEMEVKLAGLRASFSEAVADAETSSLKQIAYSEHIKAKKWLEIKKGATTKLTNGEIDKMVDEQTWEVREAEFDSIRMAKLLKMRYTSYEGVINAIKDRIKVLMGERFDRS